MASRVQLHFETWEFRMASRVLWLERQTSISLVERLKVVKAAWVLGDGALPQAWFSQNGTKD